MTLATGTRLGAYEITGSLGAGGMGEVYRATDTNLKREAAIKILPPDFANDADRVARFQREAEALAALSHTNIAQIYGLERSGETTALAMELVDGPTLAERIAEGPIQPNEALEIALQIADALEAAHDQGIVHRDLKPPNIKLRPDGTVKVLDFGIATAPEPRTATSGRRTPTRLTPALTEAGVLLGTAAYMSPEQAKGQPIDRRADIWAFGCVLYEMLAGQPPFGGEDVTTTLARVLEREASTSALPATVPPAMRQAITLCLQKDPRKRLADIRDVRLALEGAFETAVPGAPANERVARPLSRLVLPVMASVLVGALATGVAVWAMMRADGPPLARFDMTPENGVTVQNAALSAAISPDGQTIAYLAGGDSFGGGQELRLRRLDQLASVALVTNDEGRLMANPFFSPDGLQIGYWIPDIGLLRRVPIQGGAASTITGLPGQGVLRGASWGVEGSIIFATADPDSGLWRVSALGGEPELLTTPGNGEGDHLWPEVLPGGDAVLFTMTGASEEESMIAVVSLATGERRVLLQGGSSPHYSPTGHLLYARAGTLYAVGFDATRLEVLGDPVQVMEGVYTKGIVGPVEASIASNGTLLYLSRSQLGGARRLVWVDAEGRETPAPTPARAYSQLVLSRDGTRAAVGLEGERAIWLADLTRGTLQRLPADLGQGEPTVLFFSADGQRVASSAIRDGQQAIVWQAIDGVIQPEPLATFGTTVNGVRAGALSPDGMRFVATVLHGSLDLGVGVVGEPGSYTDFVATPTQEFGSAISPDGRWIAYSSNETGSYQVYVQRFPEGGGRVPVSIGDGVWPYWSADGSALIYMQLDGGTVVALVRVPVDGLGGPGSPTFGVPAQVFPWKYYAVANGVRQFGVAGDGERFLMITGDLQGDNARLVLVQNWFEQLKRMVPTD